MRGLGQRVAVISGGSHGFGRAIALGLAREGCIVVLLHSPGGGDAAHSTLTELHAFSPESMAIPVDVADEDRVSAAFSQVLAGLGRIDVVANLAGYSYRATLDELDFTEFDRLHRTVVRGVFVLCREAARTMHGGGTILNLTSTAAGTCAPGTAAYVAAKAAVEAMTGVIAEELSGRGITVQALSLEPAQGDTATTTADNEIAASVVRSLGP